MTKETLTAADTTLAEETPEEIEQTIETEIPAEELIELRKQADELKALQAKLSAEQRKKEILQRAAAEEIKGMDKIYDYLDPSFLTDEKLPEIFAAVNGYLRPKPVTIGTTMNVSHGLPGKATREQQLAEAADKARISGRAEDLAAYSILKRELIK